MEEEEPLEVVDEAAVTSPLLLSHQEQTQRAKRRTPALTWKTRLCRSVALSLLLVVAIHVVLLLLLRATRIQFHRLQIPNLCSINASNNQLVLQVTNPSVCAPQVGPVQFQVVKKQIPILQVTMPALQVPSGTTLLLTRFETRLLVSPQMLHDLVFRASVSAKDKDKDNHNKNAGEFELRGFIPIHVQCLLIPWTLQLPVGQVLLSHPDVLAKYDLWDPPSLMTLENTMPPFGSLAFMHSLAKAAWLPSKTFHDQLDEIVKQILKTISLSHFHVDNDPDQVFAFTQASFDFVSTVVWNIPAFGLQLLQLQPHPDNILIAGFDHFVLGQGPTRLSAFTKIQQSKMPPIESMLTQFLSGDDVNLRVQGFNHGSDCFALQLLDLIQVDVTLPGKIGGQHVLLRDYKVQVQLKEIDSISHTCRLDIAVRIDIHNPLPMNIDVFDVRFNLSYWDIKQSTATDATFLFRLDDNQPKHWGAHQDVNVTLRNELHTFSVCQPLLMTYIQDQLALRIDDGTIVLRVANSANFSIPFSVEKIRIHPSLLGSTDDDDDDDDGGGGGGGGPDNPAIATPLRALE